MPGLRPTRGSGDGAPGADTCCAFSGRTMDAAIASEEMNNRWGMLVVGCGLWVVGCGLRVVGGGLWVSSESRRATLADFPYSPTTHHPPPITRQARARRAFDACGRSPSFDRR